MSYEVMYQGVQLTIHAREDWQDPSRPVMGTYRFRLDPATGHPIPRSGYLMSAAIWPKRNPTLVTHQAVHYTADATTPDGDPGETIVDVRQYIRAIQNDYTRNRAYSIGYTWIVDYLGGIWTGRGRDIKCAAHAPANDYADAILVVCDGDGPTNELQDHSIRYLVHEAERETGRMQFVVGHQELKGAATQCPGPLIMNKIEDGTYYPRPDVIVPPTEPQVQEDEVSKLIKITDSGQQIDLAVMAVTGTFVEWIVTQERYELLLFLQSLETPPRPVQLVERSFLKFLTLLGQPPTYPATYTGPKTSPADFAKWVS